MTAIKHIEIRGFWCDVDECDAAIYPGRDGSVSEIPYAERASDIALLPWLGEYGWTVAKSQHYCPAHSSGDES